MPHINREDALGYSSLNREEQQAYSKKIDQIKGKNISINVDKSYIFFNSLESSRPASIYQALSNQANSYVAEARAVLDSKQILQKHDNMFQGLKKYINILNNMAMNEQASDSRLIQELTSKLQKASSGILSEQQQKLLKDARTYINKLNNPEDGPATYEMIINLMNRFMELNNSEKKKTLGILDENIAYLTERMHQIDQETGQEILLRDQHGRQIKDIQQYAVNFPQSYHRLMNHLIRKEIKDSTLQFQTTYSGLLAQKMQMILNAFASSAKGRARLQEIKVAVSAAGTGEREIQNAVKNAVIGFIYKQLKGKTYEELKKIDKSNIQETVRTVTENITRIYSQAQQEKLEQIANLTTMAGSKRRQNTIEENALITKRKTAELFYNLDPETREAIMKQYGLTDFFQQKQFKNKELSQLSSKQKEQISKRINKAISSKKGKNTDTDTFISQYINGQLLGDTEEAKILSQIINSVRVEVKGYEVAEANAAEQFTATVANALNGGNITVQGNKVNKKGDFTVSIFVDDITLDYDPKTDDGKFIDELIDRMNNFSNEFIKIYQSLSEGKTDVKQAKEAYKQIYGEIISKLKAARARFGEQSEQYQQLSNYFKNSFQGQGSVKEYTLGNNDVGFTGGSLGASIKDQLQNIYEMYSLGMISKKDSESITFAIRNSANGLKASGLKTALQLFLVGAAAMIMFDQGFSADANFIKELEDPNFMPSSFHWFIANERYYPAGYIYQMIAQNLTEAISSAENQISDIIGSASNKVLISNSVSASTIPSFIQMPIPQERWNTVKNAADASVDIKFMFLGNLLSVLQKIETAFNI